MSSSSTDRVMGSSQNQFNAVFTDKTDNSILDASDFLNLMVVQLQNQDFTNPMDNTEMVNQMATFSNMQMMQEMASYSKTMYAMSLVGKSVTASRNTVGGSLDTTTGVVDRVSLVDNEYVVYIGGKKYELSQIMSIGSAPIGSSDTGVVGDGFKITAAEAGENSVSLKWDVPTEDDLMMGSYKYEVYYSKDAPFNTVDKVEAGTKYGTMTSAQAMEVLGLDPGTRYYFNVVVTDPTGKKSVYKPIAATTKISTT